MGGGGPAETCCAEPPRRRDTTCPALPWPWPSGEEAKGLILALLADPLLPPHSCGGPGLRLWAIAPTHPPAAHGDGGSSGEDLHPWREGYF